MNSIWLQLPKRQYRQLADCRKRSSAYYKTNYKIRPITTQGGIRNSLNFQLATSTALRNSDSDIPQMSQPRLQKKLSGFAQLKNKVKTVDNEEEDRLVNQRSPLKVRNWEVQASVTVNDIDKCEKGIGCQQNKMGWLREEGREKKEKYNKIIEKLSEKQKLIGQLKKLADTPLPIRKLPYQSETIATSILSQNTYLFSESSNLQTNYYKQNLYHPLEKITKNTKEPCFYTPNRANKNSETHSWKKQSVYKDWRSLYSPQMKKSEYSWQQNTRERDIKKVTASSFFSHKSESKLNEFKLEKQLGQGKFGTVFRAVHLKTGMIYALKRMKKETIKIHMMMDQIATEIKIQSYCQHQNLVQLYDTFSEGDYLYLVLQYMEQGTLFDHLKKTKILSERETAEKIRQVTEAIRYLHEHGIAHRDIKPENVVLSGGVGKLCDFGWAAICNQRRRTCCGTFDYSAPQILQGSEYDTSVDLWCLGVLAYELLVGKAPFYHISRKETMTRIKNVEQDKITFPREISDEARDFVGKLLKKQPAERMGAEQALRHPFLRM